MLGRRRFSLGVLGLSLLSVRARAHGQGATLDVRLAGPPHPPGDAPDLVIHLPARVDPALPVHASVFMHGFSCCARALVADEPVACYRHGPVGQAYGLTRLHDATHLHNALLIVPQLAMLARDARARRLERAGGFDALLASAFAAAAQHLGGALGRGRVLLVAHSAGYRASAAVLPDAARRSPVASVLLLDALYARWDDFARFAAAGGQLVSLHTAEARTSAGNERLLARLGPRGARVPYHALQGEIGSGKALVSRVSTPHGALPVRHYTELVRALLA